MQKISSIKICSAKKTVPPYKVSWYLATIYLICRTARVCSNQKENLRLGNVQHIRDFSC